MGHLTLKMIGILISSLMVFGLAQAENRAEKTEDTRDDVEGSSLEDPSKEDKEKRSQAEERFRAQQSIQRALRDQGMAHGPVLPTVPPPKSK